MIVRKILWVVALLFLTTNAYAAEVYTGTGVYSKTVKRWTRAVKSASFGSTSWIYNTPSSDARDKLHVNGHRDTILMVPDTTIPDDITLVVWFHGLGGFSDKTFRKRLMPQIDTLVENGNSVALAIPEMPWSINTSTRRGRQGRVWRSPGDLERVVTDLKEHLMMWARIVHGSDLGTVRIMFVGHSAGGSALMSASIEGSLCRLRPETVVWSDASYGSWLDKAWSGCLRHTTDVDIHVLVRKWDRPHQNAKRFMRKIKHAKTSPRVFYRPLPRKCWTHGRIGNNALVFSDIFPPGC